MSLIKAVKRNIPKSASGIKLINKNKKKIYVNLGNLYNLANIKDKIIIGRKGSKTMKNIMIHIPMNHQKYNLINPQIINSNLKPNKKGFVDVDYIILIQKPYITLRGICKLISKYCIEIYKIYINNQPEDFMHNIIPEDASSVASEFEMYEIKITKGKNNHIYYEFDH
ncbi:MAG: hypothetical protein Edafosvirus3_87 [Edafosvirus sp.]|uniref:Uncharacterized protein n=1 Tax=Edafosvirus sp. TaxID=2487765 RepID=A0A3G4ZX57_9VIRU|nr:MAG: hypothetical protein Edafosvirus3_87 [Edafosvirus sp.]